VKLLFDTSVWVEHLRHDALARIPRKPIGARTRGGFGHAKMRGEQRPPELVADGGVAPRQVARDGLADGERLTSDGVRVQA
jgi:hypothetical protein